MKFFASVIEWLRFYFLMAWQWKPAIESANLDSRKRTLGWFYMGGRGEGEFELFASCALFVYMWFTHGLFCEFSIENYHTMLQMFFIPPRTRHHRLPAPSTYLLGTPPPPPPQTSRKKCDRTQRHATKIAGFSQTLSPSLTLSVNPFSDSPSPRISTYLNQTPT